MNTKKLKSLRVLNGLTQEKLAEMSKMSTKTYNRKELGLIPFTNEEILTLSTILNLDINLVNEIFFDNHITKCINNTNSFQTSCINS
ncbi:Helix-turn-helix [Clostridium sp. USBA 49]|uniref:helix-turn-helix transcriptional regulator n=1 Tax=Clostridium sp. USBA 49 TaxID=1881060 RepID=UPI0009993C09|nr:helix-turn-helix transcriptional regulator [Clostridium sp. USBA 49]SKA89521.1 Helix-turn-helix [Clostridium sp. USBA 49]